MLVVADASPLIGLIKVECTHVLPALYGALAIPGEVAGELASPKRPAEVQRFMKSMPLWISVRDVTRLELLPNLDAGERAAISLAKESNADLLLIDERAGREAALTLGLSTARTAAVLFDAAVAGIIPDLAAVYDRLRSTNFRVPRSALDELLRRFEKRAGRP